MKNFFQPTGFGQMFGIPNMVVDNFLKIATGIQLKVLLFCLRKNDASLTNQQIADGVGCSVDAVEDSMHFWEKSGLFNATIDDTQPVAVGVPQMSQPIPSPAPQPAIVVSAEPLPSSSKSANLDPLEIAQAVQSSADLAQVVRYATEQLGRDPRPMELKSLVWMHDYMNIPAEIIVTTIGYAKNAKDKKKHSIAYVEGIIMNWQRAGIVTYEDVMEQIQQLELRDNFSNRILRLLHIPKLSENQMEVISEWTKWNFTDDIITLAYQRTLDAKGLPVNLKFVQYMNKILKTWNQKGYKNLQEIKELDVGPEATTPSPTPTAHKNRNPVEKPMDDATRMYNQLHPNG